MPARPLLVTNDFPPRLGGIERLADQLARRLPHAAVFAPGHPEAAGFDAQAPYPVHRGRGGFLWPVATTRQDLREAVRTSGADVLLFLSPFPLPLLGPGTGLPWTVVAHGAELVLPARLPGIRRLLRRSLGRADRLFAVSGYTARHLRHLVGDDGPPIGLLRNGVDPALFQPTLDGSAVRRRYGLGNDPVVLCTGRLVPRKGQDRLVAALPDIRRRVPAARLVIVGDGRLSARLRRAARRLPRDAVVLTGRVGGGELPAHYAAADVFAHPNRSRWAGLEQEGFGVVLLEAQACGLPVVGGRSGGTPEALVNGETGLLVDGRSPTGIAHAVAGLLGDPQRRARMGEAGRRFVLDHFAWDRVAAGLAGDLAALVDGRPIVSDR